MSGIAGVLFFGAERVRDGWIEKLTEAMKPRGPDAQTHWSSESVALGHCMLRTTPESLEEHQPLASPDGNLTMVWDGRLDNREELQRELDSEGVHVRNNSDAELALQCFAVWGTGCPARLLGDFAFAVWDAERRVLFCARDHMGARPLYYTSNQQFFAFASQEEALGTLPGMAARVNEELVASYLMPEFRDIDLWQSWIQDVRLLPPAQSATISEQGVLHQEMYWQLEEGPDAQFESDEECREAFLAVFGEAVRCRMRSLGPVSAMMSGGIDSACIAAMTKRVLPHMPGKQLHTYSAVSDQPESCVESQCILSLTQDLGANAHFVSVPSFTGMLDANDLAQTAWSHPHPLDNSILLPEMMCLAASRDGHRVMLYGGTGDLTMDVPDRYIAHLLRTKQWRRSWAECKGASRNNTYLRGAAPSQILLQNLWTAYSPQGLRLLSRRLRGRLKKPGTGSSLIRPEFAAELGLVARVKTKQNNGPVTLASPQRHQIEFLTSAHGISSVLTSCDRIAGRHAIETRDPWADKRVVEFFLRLPVQYKIRDGWTKHLARTSFADDIAHAVRWRRGKEHLGWNFVCRLLDESTELITRTMEHGLARIARYVDPISARGKHMTFGRSSSDASRLDMFRLTTLSLWLQKNFQ